MKKIILSDEEYAMLQKVLRAVPPAQLPRILPDWDGADMHYYRCLLTTVLKEDYHFPKTDTVRSPRAKMVYVKELDALVQEDLLPELTPSHNGKNCQSNGAHEEEYRCSGCNH